MHIRTILAATLTAATLTLGVVTPAAQAVTPKDSYIAMLKASVAQAKKTGLSVDEGYTDKSLSQTLVLHFLSPLPLKGAIKMWGKDGVPHYRSFGWTSDADLWSRVTPGFELARTANIKTVTYTASTKTYTVTVSPGYYARKTSTCTYTVGSNGLLVKYVDDSKPAWVENFRYAVTPADNAIIIQANISTK
jgi:hypothetical protein